MNRCWRCGKSPAPFVAGSEDRECAACYLPADTRTAGEREGADEARAAAIAAICGRRP